MNSLRTRTPGFAWSRLIASTGLALLAATAAFAQQADNPAPTAAPDDSVKLEKFVVTGSNIPTTLTAGEANALPVISIGRAEIDKSGYVTAADLLQKITASNGGSVPISNNGTGFTPAASSTSIHGLGPDATLVLINGHRVADYPIGQGGQAAFVDLNSIPLSAVERIEVLTSGASAVYGADAVAGVVNIIMRKDFSGSELNFRYGNTTSKDSHEIVANYIEGATDDKSSLTAGLSFYSRAAIYQRDRSYSVIPPYLSSNSSPINAQITLDAADAALGLPAGTLPPGVHQVNSDPNDPNSPLVNPTTIFATPGITPGAAGGNTVSGDGNVVPGSTNHGTTPANQYLYSNGRLSVWNFNQSAGSYPVFERYGAFVNMDRKLFGMENVRGYFDFSYNHAYSESQLAPLATGSFVTPGSVEYVIPANTPNPLPVPDGRPRAAAIGAYNPFNPFNIDITDGTRFRLADFGNRILKTDSDAFMVTAGAKLDHVAGNWDADLGARISIISVYQDFQLVSTSRFNQIVNANDPIFDPSSSVYIGTTTPFNPFGYAGSPIAGNAASLAYATVRVKDAFSSALKNPFLTITNGELFSLPAGDAGFALGVDYRVESLNQNPDAISLLGDDGNGSENLVNKSRKVFAYFGEIKIPVFSPKQNIIGAHALDFDIAARNEDFLTSGQSKLVPSIALRYQPLDDTLTVRASYGEGIRQPSLYELYGGTAHGLVSLTDSRTGLTLPEVPVVSGSNSKLKPEKTNSINAGVVWSPKIGGLKGFTMNVDYWRVERQGTVLSNPQDTLDRFYGTSPGGLVTGESVLLDNTGTVLSVTAPYINVGKTIVDGFDLGASYVLPTASLGRFDFGAGGTYTASYKQATVSGAPLAELINTDASGGQGQDGYLRWKAKMNVDWTYHGYSAGLIANYTGGFEDFDANGNPFQVASLVTFDLQASYNFHKSLGRFLADTTLTVGVLNLLDRDPPFSSGGGSNPNGYPGFLYDSTGRFAYVQLTKKF